MLSLWPSLVNKPLDLFICLVVPSSSTVHFGFGGYALFADQHLSVGVCCLRSSKPPISELSVESQEALGLQSSCHSQLCHCGAGGTLVPCKLPLVCLETLYLQHRWLTKLSKCLVSVRRGNKNHLDYVLKHILTCFSPLITPHFQLSALLVVTHWVLTLWAPYSSRGMDSIWIHNLWLWLGWKVLPVSSGRHQEAAEQLRSHRAAHGSYIVKCHC